MTVRALSSTSTDLPVGGVWAMVVSVGDSSGCPVDVMPTVGVTLPDGSPAAPGMERVSTGVYRAELVTTLSGRYVASVTTLVNGAAQFAAYASAVVAELPDVDDLDDYLEENSWTHVQLQDALDAETAAQRNACRIPADYPADLREALLRRAQRNLAMRVQPLAVVPGSETSPAIVIPSRDPEVRRLEGPYRKLPVG
jgi:hypothetical protein